MAISIPAATSKSPSRPADRCSADRFSLESVLASGGERVPICMARILVVDDESSIREIMTRRLTKWGHEVVTASAADAAVELMSTQPAEIVFCDVIMPVHDGVWLAQQLRERWPQTVIVAVSGAQEMATVVKMRQYGAVDFVPKPIGREMLHQALERALATLAARGSDHPA